MERVSQIILRNLGEYPSGDLLLFNPPPDGLWRELSGDGRNVTAWTQDFAAYRWFEQQTAPGLAAGFGVLPAAPELPADTILFQPREKERLDMLLHFMASSLKTDARLWLVGENTSGIKSAGKHLGKYFERTFKVDSARHCALFRAETPKPVAPFELGRFQQKWLLGNPGSELRMVSFPGAFAHGRLDRGTDLLLQVIASQHGDWKAGDGVLDFGCGIGIIGISMLAREPGLRLTLLDSSALALESARLSLAANGLEAQLLPSDGLSEVKERYDWIVSNPPFHRGVATDLNIARRLISEAGSALSKRGKILLVCNRHLPYEPWLRENFAIVEAVAGDNDYSILRAARPKAS